MKTIPKFAMALCLVAPFGAARPIGMPKLLDANCPEATTPVQQLVAEIGPERTLLI